ncbi:BMA-FRPR-14 [Dirofilaria immitis]|nr:BMA-FRPR-14 [Dirofilaria immitis]
MLQTTSVYFCVAAAADSFVRIVLSAKIKDKICTPSASSVPSVPIGSNIISAGSANFNIFEASLLAQRLAKISGPWDQHSLRPPPVVTNRNKRTNKLNIQTNHSTKSNKQTRQIVEANPNLQKLIYYIGNGNNS